MLRDVYYDDTSDDDDARSPTVDQNAEKRTPRDVRVTQRSKRAIRDMVKRLDVQSAMSLRWKGEWDSEENAYDELSQ